MSDPAGDRSRPGRIVVLIVEDDDELLAHTRLGLMEEGINVETAASGAQAMAMFGRRPFDLVVLDIGVPDDAGWELLRNIRSSSDVAVMLVTGHDTDRVRGLDRGADDHLAKPYFLEFESRVRALLRRAARSHGMDGGLA
jgi:two-component system OmpR family response regulator